MNTQTILITAAGIILGFTVWIARKQDQRRTQVLKRQAMKLGLNYQKEDRALTADVFKAFHLFTQGYSRSFSNIMRVSQPDCELIISDYRYTVSGVHSLGRTIKRQRYLKINGRSFRILSCVRRMYCIELEGSLATRTSIFHRPRCFPNSIY